MRTFLATVAALALLGVPSASAMEPPATTVRSPVAPLPSPDPQHRGTAPPLLLPMPPPPCGTAMFPGFPDWVVRPARRDGCRVHPRTVPLPPYVVPHRPPGPGPGPVPVPAPPPAPGR